MPRFGRRTLTALSIFLCTTIIFWYKLVPFSTDHSRAITVVEDALKSLDTGSDLVPASKEASHASHLVLVPAHAIWKGGPENGLSDSEWILAGFQRGETGTFIKHIQAAANIARKDPNAILIFSGGQTSALAGPISEGQSYWSLAEAQDELIPDTNGLSLKSRMIVEEFARDSYENLLFSIARFKEYTSKYPALITVVGFEFKKLRFENLHRGAIHYPAAQFRYVGIDPPNLSDKVAETESANAVIPFTSDPHGCTNRLLVSKRRERNPFRRSHSYMLSCPELYNLLTICNRQNIPGSVYESLPWNQLTPSKITTSQTAQSEPTDSQESTRNSIEDDDDENIPNVSFEPSPTTLVEVSSKASSSIAAN